MNTALIVILAFIGFGLAYSFYSRYIKNVLGEDDSKPTPANTCGNMPLVFTDICLMVLAICVIILSVKKYFDIKASPPNIAPGN